MTAVRQSIEPADLIGSFRRFGPVGPVYQVNKVLRAEPNGDTVMEILLIETGETAEYGYTDILDDPKES